MKSPQTNGFSLSKKTSYQDVGLMQCEEALEGPKSKINEPEEQAAAGSVRSFQDILQEEEKHSKGSPSRPGNGSPSEETKKKNKAMLADYITSVPKDLGGIT